MARCPSGVWLIAENDLINLRETVRLSIEPMKAGLDLHQLVAYGADGQARKLASGDRERLERWRYALAEFLRAPDGPCVIDETEVEDRAERIDLGA